MQDSLWELSVGLSPRAAAWVLNVAVASIVLSGVAIVVERLMARTSLPLRHGLLCVALFVTLASPLPIWMAARRGIGLLSVAAAPPAQIASTDSAELDRASIRQMDVSRSTKLRALFGGPRSIDRTPAIPNDDGQAATGARQAANAVRAKTTDDEPRLSLSQLSRAFNSDNLRIAGTAILSVWAVVGSWFAFRFLCGLYSVHRLRRTLRPVTDPRIIAAARRAFSLPKGCSLPQVCESTSAQAPLTLGWRRPEIVMPQGVAEVLSDEQLACVLVHEVAHVRRHDTSIALLQQLAAVAFWWNPLRRMVNRRINRLRERICDDYVVAQHGDGVPLAEAIVRLAEWGMTRPAAMPLTLPLFAGDNDLERRITRLTEKARAMSIRLNKKTGMALALFAGFFTAIILVPVIGGENNKPETSANPAATREIDKSTAGSVHQRNRTTVQGPAEKKDNLTVQILVSGYAKNEAGDPVANAKIHLVSTNGIRKRLGETTTDTQGHYDFRDVQLPLQQPSQNFHLAGTLQVFGEADGFGISWHGMRFYQPRPRPADWPRHDQDNTFYQGEPIEMDLTFRAAATLAGRVTNDDGRPVADARISLSSLDYLDTEGREMHENSREFWAMSMAPSPYREARTDADGRFEFTELPAETVVYVRVRHPEYASQTFFAAITEKKINDYRFISNNRVSISNGKPFYEPIWDTRSVKSSPLDIRVDATRLITVHVVYDDNGRPAKGVRVGASSGNFQIGTSDSGTTDQNGRIELALPPGMYQVSARPPRDTDYVRTYDELTVETEPEQQTFEVRLRAGCILILKAVDAADGSGIAGVGFWTNPPGGGPARIGVQSSTSYIDYPVTNENGELRAVVNPGTRGYGVGFDVLPDGYRADPNTGGKLVECKAGETVRVQFELHR